jgi:hypothetical protein
MRDKVLVERLLKAIESQSPQAVEELFSKFFLSHKTDYFSPSPFAHRSYSLSHADGSQRHFA